MVLAKATELKETKNRNTCRVICIGEPDALNL